MVCGVGILHNGNLVPVTNVYWAIYIVFTCTLVYKIYTSSTVDRWCCSQKSNRSLIAAHMCKYLLAFFIYFIFSTFFQHLSPLLHIFFPHFSFLILTLFTSQSRDLQSHVTSTLCMPTLVRVTILILPAFINNISSNLSCSAKIQTACWMCETSTKVSRSLPAPWTGHATTVMVFSLLIYSDHPRNWNHLQNYMRSP